MKKYISIVLIIVFIAGLLCACGKNQQPSAGLCSYCGESIEKDEYKVFDSGIYYKVCKDCYAKDETTFSLKDYVVIEEVGYDGNGYVDYESINPKILFDIIGLSTEEENELLWEAILKNDADEVLLNFLKEKGYDFSKVEQALNSINISPDSINGCSNGAKFEFTVTGYESLEELFDVKFKDTTFTYEVTKLKPSPIEVNLTVDIASAPSYLGPESIELEFLNTDTNETYQISLFNHNDYKNTIEIETGEYEITQFYMGEEYVDEFKLDVVNFTVDQRHTNYLHLNVSEDF